MQKQNILDHISACDSLLKYHESIPLLDQIVTGDEKWMCQNNVKWKKSWEKLGEAPSTTSKAGLNPKKVMLCTWWDIPQGARYYEHLLESQINYLIGLIAKVSLPIRATDSST